MENERIFKLEDKLRSNELTIKFLNDKISYLNSEIDTMLNDARSELYEKNQLKDIVKAQSIKIVEFEDKILNQNLPNPVNFNSFRNINKFTDTFDRAANIQKNIEERKKILQETIGTVGISPNDKQIGYLETNGILNGTKVFIGKMGGLYYINSQNNQSYLTESHKMNNLRFLK